VYNIFKPTNKHTFCALNCYISSY